MDALDERVIGQSWEIPAPVHVGHTMTVTERDEVEKHNAFWLTCSCGAKTTVGAFHIERIVREQWTPIDALIADGYVNSADGSGSKLTSLRSFRVPESFPTVPGTTKNTIVPTVPPPTGGNGERNDLQTAPEQPKGQDEFPF